MSGWLREACAGATWHLRLVVTEVVALLQEKTHNADSSRMGPTENELGTLQNCSICEWHCAALSVGTDTQSGDVTERVVARCVPSYTPLLQTRHKQPHHRKLFCKRGAGP